MHIIPFDRPAALLEWAAPILTAAPGLHNRPYGELTVWSRRFPDGLDDIRCAGIVHGGEPVGLITWNPPAPLSVVLPAENRPAAAAALATYFRDQDWSPVRVMAPVEDLIAFGQAWHPHRGLRVEMRNLAHRLDHLVPPRPASGQLRRARLEDLETVYEWTGAFLADAFGDLSVPRPPRSMLEKGIVTGLFRLWESAGEVVSIAQYMRQTPTGIVLGGVYTPPGHRGKGYASNLVAGMVDERLGAGDRYLALFTNANNPTSNKIYQAIGFQMVGEVTMANFQD